MGCERGDSVRLIVDTTLASELHDLPNAKVVGEVEAQIGDPVDVYG